MSLFGRVYTFYRDGFRSMVLGRTLWKIIIIKLVVMFGVLKLFFFPDFLQTQFSTDQDRADYVLAVISQPGSTVTESVHVNVAAEAAESPSVLQSQTTRR